MAIPWRRVTAAAGGLVLAAIALSVLLASRGDYTERSQASEAISLLSQARTLMTDHFRNENRWPASLDTLDVQWQGKYTQAIAITQGAGGTGPFELTATLRQEGVRSAVAGRTIRMVSTDGGTTWACRAGTIDPKYLPSTCR